MEIEYKVISSHFTHLKIERQHQQGPIQLVDQWVEPYQGDQEIKGDPSDKHQRGFLLGGQPGRDEVELAVWEGGVDWQGDDEECRLEGWEVWFIFVLIWVETMTSILSWRYDL